MGLDMNALKMKATNPQPKTGFLIPDDAEELFYWRKHPNLHRWFERPYTQKGGTEDFNCNSVLVTLEDLDVLEKVNREDFEHTTGFFFGESTEEDFQTHPEFIRLAREAINNGFIVAYTPWY